MRRMAGVTLVELLVGMTLLAILLRLAVPAFSTLIQNAQIRATAESIQNGLTTARNEALQRNRTVRFTFSNSGWLVCEMDDTATSCPNGGSIQSRDAGEANGTRLSFEQRNASTNALAGTPVFTGALSFNGLGRVNPPPNGFLATGDLAIYAISHSAGTCTTSSGTLRCLNVVVGNAGQIRMCDPNTALPANDPRRC